MPIGVFDSGVGGLTVLRALLDAMPNHRFVYLGDSARAPYGVRSAEEVRAFTIEGVARLFAEGCRLVVLACNTASALALRELQRDWLPEAAPERRVLGVLVPMIEAITARRWSLEADARPAPTTGDVWVLATPATVASGAFAREAAARAPGLTLSQEGCPGLADALEAGETTTAERLAAEAVARLAARARRPADVAVLGCTHYPLVARAFRDALPETTRLLDQPAVVAASLARYLERHPEFDQPADGPGGARLLTTGDPERVAAAARPFFGRSARFSRA